MKTYQQWVVARSAETMREFELREQVAKPTMVSTYRTMPHSVGEPEAARELAVIERRRRNRRRVAVGIIIAWAALNFSLFALRSPGFALAMGATVGCGLAVAFAIHTRRHGSSDLFR
jgi:hypothetical protein